MSGENFVTRWQARLIRDGSALRYPEDVDTIERVHEAGGCDRLTVWLENRPPIHVACTAENGERIRLFTRRGWVNALSPEAKQVNMPVIEITQGDGSWQRIYVHPEHGLVFSTQDLNL